MRRSYNEDLGCYVLYGETPWGFRLNKDRTALEPDDREQAIVSVVRHMRAEGFSMRAIIDELTTLGHFTRRGRPFTLHRVFEMIHGGYKAKGPRAEYGKRRPSARP